MNIEKEIKIFVGSEEQKSSPSNPLPPGTAIRLAAWIKDAVIEWGFGRVPAGFKATIHGSRGPTADFTVPAVAADGALAVEILTRIKLSDRHVEEFSHTIWIEGAGKDFDKQADPGTPYDPMDFFRRPQTSKRPEKPGVVPPTEDVPVPDRHLLEQIYRMVKEIYERHVAGK